MSKNLLVLIALVSIYLVILLHVKIYPKIDFIYKENYTEVILWYNGKCGKIIQHLEIWHISD